MMIQPTRSLLRIASTLSVIACLLAGRPLSAQTPAPRKRLLVIGEEKGYRHEAVTHAMVTIARLGQIKNFSRTMTRVLMRLDPAKLDLDNPRVHRKDGDFAVTWIKTYGQGRVFYSTLGHIEANWDKPEMQTMIVEAIKWVLKLVDADATPRPASR